MKHKKKAAHCRKRSSAKRFAIILLALLMVVALGLCVWAGKTVIDVFRSKSDIPLDSSTPPLINYTASTTTTTTVPTTTTTTTYIDLKEVSLQAKNVILYDATSDRVLYAYQPNQLCAPASLTKMLTAATALHLCPADTWMKVGNEIDRMDSKASRAFLKKGHIYKLVDLTAALLLPSGSDAAYCIAVNVGRYVLGESASEEDAIAYFVEQMNLFAKQIGATSSHFVTVDGIHEETHLSTAEDLLCIMRHCLSQPDLAKVMGSSRYAAYHKTGGVVFTNTNLLLDTKSQHYYAYAISGKTGFTDQAGYCLAAAAQKDGRTVIAIVLGTPDANARFEDCCALFDLAFSS